jgi:GNAT superfamily N-acetyltransferase
MSIGCPGQKTPLPLPVLLNAKATVERHDQVFVEASARFIDAGAHEHAPACVPGENVAVGGFAEQIAIESPGSGRAQTILGAYLHDVVRRYHGRQPTEEEMDEARADFLTDDLAAPSGALLIACADQVPRGCVGLRFVAERLGEVTCLFVVPEVRGHGLGSRLMRALEVTARENGLMRLRLDTRSDLVEARRLYAGMGYREVSPFNLDPYAEHFFEKALVETAR